MRNINTGKLMDLLRKVNVSFIENDGIEKDLEHPEKFEEVEEVTEVKKHWSKKRIALVGGAGGALVTAGLAILAIKKHGKTAA